MIRIAVLPGDGIGGEVLAGPMALLESLATTGLIETTGPWPIGASAYGRLGDGLPPSTLQACVEADGVLLGAIGEHPGVDPAAYRPETAFLALRQALGVRVSVRHVWLGGAKPLIVVRNLLGGAYGGSDSRTESDGSTPAVDRVSLTPEQIVELSGVAITLALEHDLPLLSVDKASLWSTSRLWRAAVSREAEAHGVPVRHVYVDRMGFELASPGISPAVVLTEGLFGDILSDVACGRVGSPALCGSASLCPDAGRGEFRCVGIFEPSHGSAPRRAGQGLANPIGAYQGLSMLLSRFDSTRHIAPVLDEAIGRALNTRPLTYELAGIGEQPCSTVEMARRVNTTFAQLLATAMAPSTPVQPV